MTLSDKHRPSFPTRHQVRVLAGPARSGKTAALVQRYLQVLTEGAIGRALWIAPTNRAVDEIRGRLLDCGLVGCFSPGVCTFSRFAEAILAEADRPMRFVGRLLKRQLIERLLDEASAAGRLQHFAPIAETAGLVDLLAALISDLKRQEIWPEKFAELVESASPSAKNRELAGLYTEYQRLLNEHSLYDAEGRFWSAREMLKNGQWGPFAGVKCVVVDGFTDFTYTQHEILQLLAGRVDELTVTLPLDEASGRDDLFLKPRHTLAELTKRHSELAVEWLPRPPRTDWPAMAHLEQHLFRNPCDLTPADDTSGVEIVAASGQLAEMQSLARRIKDLLVTGDAANNGQPARPEDIVVVFRWLEGAAALVREVLDEYGIPAAIESGASLNRSPALSALLGLLQLQAEDWPFRQLLAVLSNNYFQPPWKEWRGGTAVATAEWAVRRLQVPRGRSEVLQALERRAKSIEKSLTVSPDGDPLDELDAAAQREHQRRYKIAAALLQKLSKTLSKLDHPRMLWQWRDAVEEVADETGLKQAIQEQEETVRSDFTPFDEAAWQRMKEALGAGQQLEQWLEVEPAKLPLRQFLQRLQEILTVEPLPRDHDEVGRVRVLSAPNVRAIETPYLFVAGLSEKAFPPPARDDRIYSEAECRHWNDVGLRFIDQHQRCCEEMLLFYEVATHLTRRLVLSYPALDETAQPLLPSPYLVELRRCLGEDRLPITREISLSPVPQHEHPYSATERRVKAVNELLAGKLEPFVMLVRTESIQGNTANLTAALQTIAARAQRDVFGQFEGIFSSDAAKKRLSERYGPEHCWSVSRLEEYAYCPFRFFLTSVLGLEELPELSLEIDYGRRGLLAHEALAALHRRLNARGKLCSPAEIDQAKFNQLRDETLALLVEQITPGSALDAALRNIDVRLVAQWFETYFDQHAEYDKAGQSLDQSPRPAHFEVSFGLKRRRSEVEVDPLSTETPFELRCGEETIRLSGRIDRIDIGLVGGQVVFNVLDYKTGSRKRLKMEDFHAGLALQLPLYALAVEELLMIDRRAKPWRVGYWYLKAKGFETHGLPQLHDKTDAGLGETEAWRDLRGTLLDRVLSLVRGIRGGMFPVFSPDDQCTSRCPYNTVCRVGQVRALDKQWMLPQSDVSQR